MPTTDSLIDAFLNVTASLRAAVSDMSRDQLTARPVAGKWSTLDVVAHLADSDQAWCHRMKRVISEERPLLIGYDESGFTAALGYADRDIAFELDLIDAQRRQMAAALRSLPESAWDRTGVHNERGLVALREMVVIETEHVTHHVRTIVEKRRALGLSEIS